MYWTLRDPPESNRTEAVYYEMHRFVRRQGFDVTSFRSVGDVRLLAAAANRHDPHRVELEATTMVLSLTQILS